MGVSSVYLATDVNNYDTQVFLIVIVRVKSRHNLPEHRQKYRPTRTS